MNHNNCCETNRLTGNSPGRWTGNTEIISRQQIAADTWKLVISAPEIAQSATPGQFLMLRLPNQNDPLLGRAFAVYNVDPESGTVAVVYLTVGKMTRLLSQKKEGDQLEVTGPLGNGWDAFIRWLPPQFSTTRSSSSTRHIIMVAGGIGQTPFYLFTQRLKNRTIQLPGNEEPRLTLLIGAKTASRLACLDDFTALGIAVVPVTEDGTLGERGRVTDFIASVVTGSEIRPGQTKILCCGPTPMLASAWKVSQSLGIQCWVSLESAMSCGLGICYGCVVPYLENDGIWDYRRTCVDGPVFDASRLKWE